MENSFLSTDQKGNFKLFANRHNYERKYFIGGGRVRTNL